MERLTRHLRHWRSVLPARIAASFSGRLSGKLLVFTIGFVMLAEVLIYVPSIANFRQMWLSERLEAAQIASLALEAAGDQRLMPELESELLRNAEVISVALRRDDRRELILSSDMPGMLNARYDLRGATALELIADAFETLFAGPGRIIAAAGEPRYSGGRFIEIVINEQPLREAMFAYSRNILVLSVVISVITAALVFITLNRTLVMPMQRLTANMVRFRQKPDDASRVMVPGDRNDEIGTAERELAAMQGDIRQALRQQAHLAALGSAVSKINHDLRNILATTQLLSDRLSGVDDPTVKAVSPRLFAAIDRAIKLATDTMKYGKAAEAPPQRVTLMLAPLLRETAEAALPQEQQQVTVKVDAPEGITADADPDQLFRVLLNLTRNAVQAMEQTGGTLTLSARRDDSGTTITVRDTGPGLPDEAKESLFTPFAGSARAGGTGLGLAVAAELIEAHGGRITLEHSEPGHTAFSIFLPRLETAVDFSTASRERVS